MGGYRQPGYNLMVEPACLETVLFRMRQSSFPARARVAKLDARLDQHEVGRL
jgi:hypothetical protein